MQRPEPQKPRFFHGTIPRVLSSLEWLWLILQLFWKCLSFQQQRHVCHYFCSLVCLFLRQSLWLSMASFCQFSSFNLPTTHTTMHGFLHNLKKKKKSPRLLSPYKRLWALSPLFSSKGWATHPLWYRSSSWSTVWSQYSNTRWSLRFLRKTSRRLTRLGCLSCWNQKRQGGEYGLWESFSGFQPVEIKVSPLHEVHSLCGRSLKSSPPELSSQAVCQRLRDQGLGTLWQQSSEKTG